METTPDEFPVPDASAQSWAPDAAPMFVNVYDKLRHLAARYISERSGTDDIEPTALVHDVFLKLNKAKGLTDASDTKYYAYAATSMRRILVNHFRKNSAKKRGGEWHRTEFHEARVITMSRGEDVLALDAALIKLKEIDELRASVVEMRFFGGMTNKEVAEALKCSESTIKNKWAATRAWLRKELAENIAADPRGRPSGLLA